MTLYPTDKPLFASRLKHLRISKNFTIRQMSSLFGVSVRNYAQYECEDCKYFPHEDIAFNMLKTLGSDTFNYVFGLSHKSIDIEPLLEYPIDRALFASRIKEVRQSKNLSNQKMAAFLGVPEKNYRRYQLGVRFPSYEAVLAISKKVEPQVFDYIFGIAHEKPVGVK